MNAGAPLAVLLAAAAPVAAQTGATIDGPKFVQPGDKSDRFKAAPERDPCLSFVRLGIKFCPDSTDWRLERTHDPSEPGLYFLDEQRLAAITFVPIVPYDTARDLAPADLENLTDTYVFQDGPRGKLERVAEISRTTRPSGGLLGLAAIVRRENGEQALLQLSIFVLDYGLAFVETTINVPGMEPAFDVTDAQSNVHQSFLKATVITHIL